MEQATRANGKIIKDRDLESKSGKKAPSMKDTG